MPGCAAPKSSMRPQARSVCRIGIPMREPSRRSTFETQTAIVVTDTDSSPRFYRDLLGLHVAGTSENYGTEQEHLKNVFGAHLRITSLRAAQGPGIEFLEYLAPRTGRPAPTDTAADDLWYWQINLRAREPDGAARELRAARARFLSPDTTAAHDGALGFHTGVIVRDPDGHASLIAH